jgi:integrase
MFVAVRNTGHMAFYIRYRDQQQHTRYHKIGRVTDISLSDAKKAALKVRAGILLGNYPGVDKQAIQHCMTFSDFWITKYLPYATPRKRSIRDDEKLYSKRLKDLFGSTPLNQVTRHDLQQMHSDLRSELSASSYDHHLGLMSRCLRLASEDWNLIPENPAKGLKKYNEQNRRERLMTDSELQRLMAILDTDPARTACLALKMCLLTSARKGEVL